MLYRRACPLRSSPMVGVGAATATCSRKGAQSTTGTVPARAPGIPAQENRLANAAGMTPFPCTTMATAVSCRVSSTWGLSAKPYCFACPQQFQEELPSDSAAPAANGTLRAGGIKTRIFVPTPCGGTPIEFARRYRKLGPGAGHQVVTIHRNKYPPGR